MVQLFEHQTNIIDYLFRVAPTQKGLLVAHFMGTGKSITALCFLMQYHMSDRSKRLTIVHPEGLRHIWTTETRVLGVPDLMKHIDFFTHDEYVKMCLRKNAPNQRSRVVVIDEAHVMIKIIKDLRIDDTRKLLETLRSLHRILCLTGTPIYNDEYDLSWLINICAGKPVMPVYSKEFDRRFKVLNKEVYGVGSRVKDYAIGLKRFIGYHVMDKFKAIHSYEFFSRIYTAHKFFLLVFAPKLMAERFKEETKIFTKKALINTVLAYLIIYAIDNISKRLRRKRFEEDYIVDVDKLMDAAGPYISIFEIKDVSKDKASHYASLKINYKSFAYTLGQLQVFVSMTIPGTESETYMKLMPADYSLDDASLLGDIFEKNETWGYFFMNRGRIIGNLRERETDSNKFKMIFKTMAAAKMQRVVIWSHFWEQGAKLFGDFLARNGVRYAYIMPGITTVAYQAIQAKFIDGEIQVMILHPTIKTGLSVFGARQLHILEPVFLHSEQEQIIARVRRYDSHKMVPLKERHVDVFVWYATLDGIITTNMLKAMHMKEWASKFMLTHAVGKLPFDEKYVSNMTPDAEVKSYSAKIDGLMDYIKEKGKYTIDSIVKRTIEVDKKQCCLWNPKKSDVNECLKTQDYCS
jgi:hypothetical protein